MSGFYNVKRAFRMALAGSVCAFALTAGAAMAETKDFNVPAGDLRVALDTYIRQSGARVLYLDEDVRGRTSQGAKGNLSPEEALAQILKDANLVVTRSENGAIMIAKAPQGEAAQGAATAPEEAVEVVVTGTHIRGGNPTSPVHAVTRKDIEQSGYSQIGDVMRSLPENFSGGQNPGVLPGANAQNADNYNVTNTSSVNLRGLGPSATLVLLNGHRLPSDYIYQGSDISGIPLAAIQRVEIVTDGASALYGSDAVAGVVNMILRKDYEGGEISARLGGTAQGGGTERTYSLLEGVSRDKWYALFNLEYSKQDAITAADRAFTKDVSPITTLLGPNERKSLFLSVGRDITNRIKFSLDGLLTDRQSSSAVKYAETYVWGGVTYPYPVYTNSVYTPSYSVASNLDVNLPNDWKLHIAGVASGARNSLLSGTITPTSSSSRISHYKNDVQYIEATADGTLFHLPAGDVKAALGGGYRKEEFQLNYPGGRSYVHASRDVTYLYAEALVPLVAPSESRTGLHELELSLAGRTEEYSDFGKTTNPKIGLRYVPLEDLTLRGTWGRSFKAPSFYQMYSASYLYLYPSTVVGGTGARTALVIMGGNPDLKPEKATSWTIGADYNPALLKSMKLSATYFDIDYADRVVTPIPIITTSLSNSSYAPFVDYAPSTTSIAELLSQATYFYNYASPADPSDASVVVYDTYQNATAQTVRGLDISYRQTFTIPIGSLNAFANATWLQLKQQTLVTLPRTELSGTIFNAPRFKARGGLSWQRGGLSATGIVNFISSETDTGVTPNAEIASWTTVDANLYYRFAQSSGAAKGVKIALSASNLFDRDPPRAGSSQAVFTGVYYDSTNSSVIGRFVSLTVSKAW